ncbi:A/G-specific adenine glycosylase [Hyphomicrobium methylovorum]|uniref:A/G-specific adenine glycosylase n=1 Tax=Hyphomicrobium methylovorum TaxID=84 RepID=UPI0015E75CAB|nr:A/G-specific adenine glycosylase [Hyphomicrobium methylovorum]MBA2125811.1 A/G-specific adenine glycosylase [Hyphomicrobium methylovorum]
MGAQQHRQRQLPLRPAGPATVAALLAWYEAERRDLPWRYGPRKKADPYRVWLSEIMLQQTTVKAVIPYFQKFIARWPTVAALADAPLEAILQQWAGLGYYSRARNLKACAEAIVRDHGGAFPRKEAELLALPGIGPYTAAAITAIAFGEKATPVDGNIERVVSRLFAVEQPLPGAKCEIRNLAATLTPARRAGDFAQAMMDLGAEVCTPKRPSCLMCPVQQDCAANARGLAEVLPMRAQKAARPSRYGVAFLVQREDGAVLLRQRPEAGLLGGMLEVPSTPWNDEAPARREALRSAPVTTSWVAVPGSVVHVFTHFRLELTVYRALVPADASFTLWAEQERCRWVARRDLHGQALPTVMKKIIAHGFSTNG